MVFLDVLTQLPAGATFFNVLLVAYLDPGSGSFLFQMLIAGLVTIAFVIKTYWNALKSFFKRIFSRSSAEEIDAED